MTLQVLDTAPGEVAGIGAHPGGKIAALHQTDFYAFAGQRRRRNRAVNTPADDQYIELLAIQGFDGAVAQCCRHVSSKLL